MLLLRVEGVGGIDYIQKKHIFFNFEMSVLGRILQIIREIRNPWNHLYKAYDSILLSPKQKYDSTKPHKSVILRDGCDFFGLRMCAPSLSFSEKGNY